MLAGTCKNICFDELFQAVVFVHREGIIISLFCNALSHNCLLEQIWDEHGIMKDVIYHLLLATPM